MVFEPNRSRRIWIQIVTLGWDLIWIKLLKLNPNPNPSPNPNPNPNRIHTHKMFIRRITTRLALVILM